MIIIQSFVLGMCATSAVLNHSTSALMAEGCAHDIPFLIWFLIRLFLCIPLDETAYIAVHCILCEAQVHSFKKNLLLFQGQMKVSDGDLSVLDCGDVFSI